MNLDDYREAARKSLSGPAYDYYAGGARDEITLRENRRAYGRVGLRYRVLRDVSDRDLSIRLFGHHLSMPVLAAPTAFHSLAHPEGEVATARAVGEAGTVMMLSTLSNRPMEEVTAAASGPVWFQLYVYRDRETTAELVRRAEACGCSALVLTADAQLWGVRERDVRNRFRLPEGLEMANLAAAGMEAFPEDVEDSGLAAYVESLFDPSLTWADLAWLRDLTDLPVLVKGVVHPEDARLAVEHGADGVVVSNHGGRQLDTAMPTVEALPEVAGAVDGRIPVLVDGGIRRGTDVLKALALGADAVALGRPILWGLAVGGAEGVREVLEMLRGEFDTALGLCGCSSVAELDESLLVTDLRSGSSGALRDGG